MRETENIRDRIEKQLPEELASLISLAGELAGHLDQRLFLAGGAIRDLLLERRNVDLDLVTEGDCLKLATKLAETKQGHATVHSRFNTARIKWNGWTVDLATARTETYIKPGALPVVYPSDIYSDLKRRDFGINSMAACLDPQTFGELIDPCHGEEDLKRQSIRILHDRSFIDDATRIWRAVRYEQRLNFQIEPHSLELLQKNLAYLDTISGDRIRHELELCLKEEQPEKALERAGELGILQKINESLNIGPRTLGNIALARDLFRTDRLSDDLYLALLFYQLNRAELEKIMAYLKIPRLSAQKLQDNLKLKEDLNDLADPKARPSQIYHSLKPFSRIAVQANLIQTDSSVVKRHLELYLNNLHSVQPILKGENLIKMGVTSGPRVKEILDFLRDQRLDGLISTIDEEINLVKKQYL